MAYIMHEIKNTAEYSNPTEFLLAISSIKQVSSDCVEITFCDGPVFFIRFCYLKLVHCERIQNGEVFSAEESLDIIQAGLAFNAERKALSYLARCEQCRFGLERKLLQKGFEKNPINDALDYLESKNLLSDYRFAESWVRTNASLKAHGKARLLKELLSRGISKNTATSVLDEFFESTDELKLCLKAYEKALKQGKNQEKLIKYLIDSGFSYRMIKSTIKMKSEEAS